MSLYNRYGYRRYGNGNGMSTARKADIAYKSTRKIVKRQEVKTHESAFTHTFLGGGIGSQVFSGFGKVPRGVGEDDRLGSSIVPTSLRLKIRLQADDMGNPISGNFTMLLRIIVFIWKDVGDPTLSQLLESIALLSHKSDLYKYNSKILYDKVHRLDSQIQMDYLDLVLKKEFYRYPIRYDNDASPDYMANGLHIGLICDPGPTAGQLRFDCVSRLCFKDT